MNVAVSVTKFALDIGHVMFISGRNGRVVLIGNQ